MEQTTFWLTTSTNDAAGDGGNLSGATQQQNKEVELSSMLNQPTMMNFATIFAGASAAVASSGSTNMLARVPSLSQIGIPPSGHLAKQGQILAPISSLQAVPNINQMSLHPQSQPMTSAVTVNSLNNIQPLTTTIYTLPLPTDPIQIPKNFLQQAAAASGLTSTSGDSQNNTSIVIAPQRINPVNISATLPATPQIIQAATPQSSAQPVAVQQPSTQAPATYQCGECNKTFENSGQLSYHTFVTHAQLQARPHKCTACPESFLLDHHLRDHMRAIHLPPEQGGGAPFTCSECMASFDDGGHLNFHLYMAHTIQGAKPAQQQQFPCPECGKSFIKPALLSAHIRNVHCGQVYTLVAATPAPTVAVPEPKNFKCNDCGKAFKTASYLKQHNMSVHEKPLKCMLCQKGFGRKSELKRHMRGVHMRERPHVCSICGWTFAEIGNLKHHIQAVHQKDKPYRCMYCDKTFSLTSYLRTHLLRMHNIDPENLKGHEAMEVESSQQQQQQPQQQQQQQQQQPAQLTLTSGEQNAQAAIVGLASSGSNTVAIQALQLSVAQTHLIRCYECGQVFQNPQLLQSHVLSSHTQPFWCTVCGEGFSLASQLTLHLQLRHSSDEHNNPNNNVQTVQTVALQAAGPVTIELPQSITPSQSQQQQQIITSQQNLTTTQQPQQQQQQSNTINIAPNKCPLCNATYDTAPDKHVCTWKKQIESACATAMAIANERPHVCGECGKAFKTTTHLKQHIRCVHSKERPHQCTVCEKSFARTSDLNRHVKGVHQRMKMVRSSVFVTLKCSECGAIYTETSQLKRHIYTTHLRGRPSFKCADCQEGFSDEIAFQNHICHEVERPHVCSCCSKRFSMGAQLRRHMRAAHGRTSDEPMIHKCFQCNRNFGRPIDLERHIQAVHLKEKPHKCTLCGKSFGLQGNLNKHVRAVHLLEKPHQCIECGKRFAHVGVLKRHLRDIHFYDKKASVKQKLAQLQMEGRVMQNVQQPEEQQQQKTDNVVSQADNNLQQAIQVIATASNQPQQTTSLQTIQVIANSIARQQAHQQVTTSPQSQQVVQQTIQVIANMARQQSQQLQATEPQVIQQTANLQSVANVVRRQSQHATESQQLTQQADNLQSFAELARPQSQPATDQQHNIDLQSVADIVRRQSQLATDLHPQQVVQHSANLQSFAELARRHSTTEPQQVVQQTINLQAANIVRRQSQQTTEPQQVIQQTINSQSFADLARHQPATEPQQQANINLAPVARQQSQNTPDQQPMQQTVNLQNFSALSNQQQSQTSNSLSIQAIARQQAPGVAQHTTNLQAIRAIANMARQQQQQQQQQQTTQPQLMQQVTDLQAIQAIANIARQSQQQATQGQPGTQQMHPTEPTPSA